MDSVHPPIHVSLLVIHHTHHQAPPGSDVGLVVYRDVRLLFCPLAKLMVQFPTPH